MNRRMFLNLGLVVLLSPAAAAADPQPGPAVPASALGQPAEDDPPPRAAGSPPSTSTIAGVDLSGWWAWRVGETQREVVVLVDRVAVWAEGWTVRMDHRLVAPELLLLGAAKLFWLLVVLVVFLWVRTRIAWFVTLAVRWGAKTALFRLRVGSLVRWAGLVQNLLPPLVIVAFVYAGLAIVGFASPEVRFVEIVCRWAALYLLGRQFLLGLSRRISPGRPALLQVSPATVERLRLTYARLGLVLAIGAMLDHLSRAFIGVGHLHQSLELVVSGLVSVWAVWATAAWRQAVGQRWLDAFPEPAGQPDRLRRAARWMVDNRWGALLTPVALVALGVLGGTRLFARLLADRGVFSYLRARRLRRQATLVEGETDTTVMRPGERLPQSYLDAFPMNTLLGDSDEVVLRRAELVDEITAQFQRWQRLRVDSSLVLIGEKGAGKTTLMRKVVARLDDTTSWHHTLHGKPCSEAALCAQLCASFSLPELTTVAEVAQALNAAGPAVIFIDEAHNSFLRTLYGHRGLGALVQLVNSTADSIFWLLSFNSFAWDFVTASRRRIHYFSRTLRVPPWTAHQLQDVIRRRNLRTGFELEFDEALLDEESAFESGATGPARGRLGSAAANGFELIEGAEGYFRMLWEASGGNPRLAVAHWLSSLTIAGHKRLRVSLFSQVGHEALMKLTDEALFALAALCQHDNLTASELQNVLNVRAGLANFLIRHLRDQGLIRVVAEHRETETIDEAFLLASEDAVGGSSTSGRRYTVAARHYRQILHVLRRKHLLWEGQ